MCPLYLDTETHRLLLANTLPGSHLALNLGNEDSIVISFQHPRTPIWPLDNNTHRPSAKVKPQKLEQTRKPTPPTPTEGS